MSFSSIANTDFLEEGKVCQGDQSQRFSKERKTLLGWRPSMAQDGWPDKSVFECCVVVCNKNKNARKLRLHLRGGDITWMTDGK